MILIVCMYVLYIYISIDRGSFHLYLLPILDAQLFLKGKNINRFLSFYLYLFFIYLIYFFFYSFILLHLSHHLYSKTRQQGTLLSSLNSKEIEYRRRGVEIADFQRPKEQKKYIYK